MLRWCEERGEVKSKGVTPDMLSRLPTAKFKRYYRIIALFLTCFFPYI
jgi:hypothetical protein